MVAENPVLKPLPATTGLGEKAAPADVMGAMNRERGGAPTTTRNSVDILREGLMEQLGDEQQVQQAIAELDKLSSVGLSGLVQIGNTVFLVNKFDSNRKMLPVGTAEVHIFTNESLQALAQRLLVGANTFRQLGYRRIISFSTDPGITRVLQGLQQQTGAQLRVTQDVQNMGGNMTPVYRIEVTL